MAGNLTDLVNIGTAERPVWVSPDATSNDPEKQREFWEGVASGSILPSADASTDQKALEILLKKDGK